MHTEFSRQRSLRCLLRGILGSDIPYIVIGQFCAPSFRAFRVGIRLCVSSMTLPSCASCASFLSGDGKLLPVFFGKGWHLFAWEFPALVCFTYLLSGFLRNRMTDQSDTLRFFKIRVGPSRKRRSPHALPCIVRMFNSWYPASAIGQVGQTSARLSVIGDPILLSIAICGFFNNSRNRPEISLKQSKYPSAHVAQFRFARITDMPPDPLIKRLLSDTDISNLVGSWINQDVDDVKYSRGRIVLHHDSSERFSWCYWRDCEGSSFAPAFLF